MVSSLDRIVILPYTLNGFQQFFQIDAIERSVGDIYQMNFALRIYRKYSRF